MSTTDIFGRIKGSDGKLYFLYGNGFTDGSGTELKIQDIGGVLTSAGEFLASRAIQDLAIMCSDGSILTTLVITDKGGGILASWRGCERGHDDFYNLDVKNLAIPMQKGAVITVNTGD